MQRLAADVPQLLRFLAVGVLNTGFGYAVFVGLLWLGAESFPALVIATAAGVAFNFQTTRALVFSAPGKFGRFAGVYICVLAVNWLALSELERLGSTPWLAQGLLALPLALLSFTAQKLLVFGRRGRPS